MTDQLANGETGTWKYEIASDEDPDILTVAELVCDLAAEIVGVETTVELTENLREDSETLVSD